MNFSKKRLRIAGLLLGITMLGSVVAGCGGDQAANDDTIKVGANFEITGNVANYGTTARDGFNLAIKEANEAGGINGKKLLLLKPITNQTQQNLQTQLQNLSLMIKLSLL